MNHRARAAIIPGLLLLSACSLGVRSPQANVSPSAADALEKVTEKGPVKLVVRIAPREPRLSDLVQMEVDVTVRPGVVVRPPAFGQAVGDFLVRDYSEHMYSNVADNGDALETRRFAYQLEPTQAGRHLIRSVAVEFVDDRPVAEGKGAVSVIESDPIEIHVTSLLGDEIPDLSHLEPMLAPQPLPRRWPWTPWAIGTVVAALGLTWYFYRKRQRGIVPAQLPTAEERAEAELSQLLTENLPSQGRFPEFYVRLTGIVRYYIEATTGLRAPEQTTEEFLRDMRSRAVFPPGRSTRLQEFLEAADMVKYAAQTPNDGEVETSIDRAREFIGMTPTTVRPTAAAEET